MSPVIPAAMAGGGAALAGVAVLRLAWRRPGRRLWLAAGWALAAAGVLAWRRIAGLDEAMALALLAACLAGCAVVFAGAKVRGERGRKAPRAEPCGPAPGGRRWRGLARLALAGPLAAAAAIGPAAALALRAPWAEADRLAAAGLLAPLLWALAMAWATTDGRLARIALGLAATAAAGFAGAAL